MTFLKLFFAITISLTVPLAYGESYGKYVGTVQTEWLDEDGRTMRLLAPFTYVAPDGQEWVAPKGSVIDGASIPQFAWSIIGGPFEGKYRNASVIHDVGCDEKSKPWESVHEVFYWAMLASGVESWRAKIMYAAVYHFGPRWTRIVTIREIRGEQAAPRALEKALSDAAPDSTAEIMATRLLPSDVPHFPGIEQAVDFEVRINPPLGGMAERDFQELKQKIVNGKPRIVPGGEGGGGGDREMIELSLEDIRKFRPEK